jgi:2-methylcitrate dehydratase PrpD
VTIVRDLAEFSSGTTLSDVSADALAETKRLLLDSIGCALAAHATPKGSIGRTYGEQLGAGSDESTVLGSPVRTSRYGAAFANGELISALDYDAILPPGHVSPYVIPGALATAEARGASGEELLVSLAVAHEMSYRFGKSMDWTRDTFDGKVSVSEVLGYTSTIFGATAAIARVDGQDVEQTANALGIAANISPVNSHRSWMNRALSTTIKYTMAGALAQSAMTAAGMAALGHRGDQYVLDDSEVGYRRFIGTKRWVPENLTDGLGTDWRFPSESAIKPYPHCRVGHAIFDAITHIMETEDIGPGEIDAIRAWGEGWIMLPVWLNNEIQTVHDAQFSINHGIAVAAQRIPRGPAWQDPEVVFDPAVLGLMDRITFEPHPEWVSALGRHPGARPTRVEIDARGTTFAEDRDFPKGSPSPDPSTRMSDEEVVEKFLVNAARSLTSQQAESAVHAVLRLEDQPDVATTIRLLAPAG